MAEFKKFVILDVALIIVWTFFIAEIGKTVRPDNLLVELSGAACGASLGFCMGLLYKSLIKKIKN